MKAAILCDDRDIRLSEAPDPRIRPDEVLVETGYAGICGTDLHIYRGEFHGRVKFPAILGHEFGGIIREVGREVHGFKPGDRVVVDPIISCHDCPACLTGHLNACRTLKLLGVDLDGGFGQYVAVPSSHLFLMPDNVPMEYAPMVEMYGLGNHILWRGGVQPGETVVILGAGKLGLSVLDVLCHSANPGLTIITDVQPFRLEIARKLGADYAIHAEHDDPVARVAEITHGLGADCVIECVGHLPRDRGPRGAAGAGGQDDPPRGPRRDGRVGRAAFGGPLQDAGAQRSADHRLARDVGRIPAGHPHDEPGPAAS